eukprot:comp22937_c0_seq1/m.36346 comp22937_c0_seq1/g.36346  ORF comp22937_c0_seq1/g.36346 comp22937_c0_seq1/m.36346 type:complete len:607 (-) comp22937_c0_seq1:400-2220(-)
MQRVSMIVRTLRGAAPLLRVAAARPAVSYVAANRVAGLVSKRSYATAAAKHDMFCYQCEQTQGGTGCTTMGVCGKTPETAGLQDVLIHSLKSLSSYAVLCRSVGVQPGEEIDVFSLDGLFSTLTNVNFDSPRFTVYVDQALKYRDQLKSQYEAACKAKGIKPEVPVLASYRPNAGSVEALAAEAAAVGVEGRQEELGKSVAGVQEMVVYGLKGLAAYAHHAWCLGKSDPAVFAFVHEALHTLTTADSKDLGKLLPLALKVGEVNVRVLQILDDGHHEKFGQMTPVQVRTTPVKGKAILVSGHDMADLERILQAAQKKGVNVYTHGEMLPAHAYPGLKKYPNLAGHFGGPWQMQKFEFGKFPGPIIMTTNCLVEPRQTYKDRIYTTGPTGFAGVKHLGNKDFDTAVDHALKLDGYAETAKDEKPLTTGFGHRTVMSVADKVIAAIDAKALNHIFVIGGCDGSEGERNYFTQLAKATPKDSIILTAGCGKYRINKLELGELGGLPRLLDMGQCNDSYGAVVVALALAQHYKTDVNGLPLSLAISWFEQKAVAVLLSLLHLGVQNIRIGPNLPGFVTPEVLDVLIEKFNLKLTNTKDVEGDLKKMLANN